jgi:hypothetical protein
MRLFGEAIHPLMDATSPMHTNGFNSPLSWNPLNPWGHSPRDWIGKETSDDITNKIYEQNTTLIQDAYGATGLFTHTTGTNCPPFEGDGRDPF